MKIKCVQIGAVFLGVAMLSGCGSDKNNGGDSAAPAGSGGAPAVKNAPLGGGSGGQTELSYDFTYNSCSTGKKVASSQDQYCKMLADDEQNRDAKTKEICATYLRYLAWKAAQCPGSMTNPEATLPSQPVPHGVSTPSTVSSSGPSTVSSSGPSTVSSSPKNMRCSMNSSYVTVDGSDAFYYFDGNARMDAYVLLVKSGFCAEKSILGVNSSYITLNGNNVFSFFAPDDRMKNLIRLYESDFLSSNNHRCSVNASYIVFDGSNLTSIFDAQERLDKLLDLLKKGVCL